MSKTNQHLKKVEYGDFQTPLELAKSVCEKLVSMGVLPDVIIEPTCGLGSFIEACSDHFPRARKIIGVEINPDYIQKVLEQKSQFQGNERIQLIHGDFFSFDWETTLPLDGSLLVIGNFPWVTNSQQGLMGGANLPNKKNIGNFNGMDALTGKSNFDISEWMLIQVANWFRSRRGYLAMLVKTSVARKFLNYLHIHQIPTLRSSLYLINTRKYFNASVEAALLFCEFDGISHWYECQVYENLTGPKIYTVGYRDGLIIRDLETFERLFPLYGKSQMKWRSGIKHDCAEVMELQKVGEQWINGLGETVRIETTFLYPLLKGSDIAHHRVESTNRYLIVPQKKIGEATHLIKTLAPKTWEYLHSHLRYFERRKSKIYKNSPPFSIFGVGDYTFAPYKVAICGLYKRLDFRLVRPIEGKPVVFDDTVYFVSFHSEEEALKAIDFLSSPAVQEFYSALIFWDEKRPIKSSLLNSLNWKELEKTSPQARLF